MPNESSNGNPTALVLELLADKKKCKQWIVEILADDWDYPKKYVKPLVGILYPLVVQFFGGTAQRGVARFHEYLSGKFATYDKLAVKVAQALAYKVESKQVKDAMLGALLNAPGGTDPEKWNLLDESTQIAIRELETLNLLVDRIAELKAKVRLRIPRSPIQLKDSQNPRPSEILPPYREFIPFFERFQEERVLQQFRDGEDLFRWMALIGDGGMGKTRLAMQFCDDSQDKLYEFWHAGFLAEDELKALVDHPQFGDWEPLVDTLIVVDYAAGKREPLEPLLRRCARYSLDCADRPDAPRIRLLLLERHGSLEGGWLHELAKCGEADLKSVISDCWFEALEIRSLGADPAKAADWVLDKTCRGWGELTGKTPPSLPDLPPDDLERLLERTDRRPLYLQMAALRACQTGNPGGILYWGKRDLLEWAVERECDCIRRLAPDSSLRDCAERAAALACLAGPLDLGSPAWRDALEEEAAEAGCRNVVNPHAINEVLRQWMVDEETPRFATPLQPDLLASAFTATILRKLESGRTASLQRALNLGGLGTWRTLLRLVPDLYLIEGFDGVETWLSPLLGNRPIQELLILRGALPDYSVSLALFSVHLYQHLLACLQDTPETLEERALLYNNLGNFLSNLGQEEEALEATQRAVEIREELVNKNRDAFLPDLAASLNNLGGRFNEVGRREEALEATRRAVEIREELVKKNRNAFLPVLAGSLNNQGKMFSDVGRREEALEATRRAVQFYEELVKKNRDAFLPVLAASLNNLGIRFSEAGRREEALEATRRAVEIREELVKKNRDAFLPVLAGSLNNLGNIYSEAGRREEALEATQCAVEIREELVKKNRDAFLPDLAGSLNNLGKMFSDVGRREKALEATQRAVNMYGELFQKYPQAFARNFRISLNNLKDRYSDLGQNEEAQAIENLINKILKE